MKLILILHFSRNTFNSDCCSVSVCYLVQNRIAGLELNLQAMVQSQARSGAIILFSRGGWPQFRFPVKIWWSGKYLSAIHHETYGNTMKHSYQIQERVMPCEVEMNISVFLIIRCGVLFVGSSATNESILPGWTMLIRPDQSEWGHNARLYLAHLTCKRVIFTCRGTSLYRKPLPGRQEHSSRENRSFVLYQ